MGDISHSAGVAIGAGAYAQGTIGQQDREALREQIIALQAEVERADLPDSAKAVLREKLVPKLAEAVDAPEPRGQLADGLERLNDNLEAVGATAGIAVSTVAPFLAGLL